VIPQNPPQQQPPPSTTPPVVGDAPGSSTTGSTPDTDPTITALQSATTSDHGSIHSLRKQRRATLRYLRSTNRAEKAAFRAVSQQLAALQKHTRGVGASAENVDLVTSLSAEAMSLRQTIRYTKAALSTNRRVDFASIHSARKKLASDLRAFRHAIHRVGHKRAA
jgi:hypothetical protein